MDKKLIQVIIASLIFVLFASGVFFNIKILPYLLAPLIIANIVFLFVNKTKGLFVNIIMLLLIPLLFVFIVEYLTLIVGAVLSLYHASRIILIYVRGDKKKK